MEKRCVMVATLLTVLGFAGLWEQASAEGKHREWIQAVLGLF